MFTYRNSKVVCLHIWKTISYIDYIIKLGFTGITITSQSSFPPGWMTSSKWRQVRFKPGLLQPQQGDQSEKASKFYFFLWLCPHFPPTVRKVYKMHTCRWNCCPVRGCLIFYDVSFLTLGQVALIQRNSWGCAATCVPLTAWFSHECGVWPGERLTNKTTL